MKKRFLISCVVAVFLLLISILLQVASAVDYPKKPVTIIVPYSAGGRTDTIARIFIQVFSKNIGQSAVVVNKPGAGSALGTMEVTKSNPDGYTLALTSTAVVASKYMIPEEIDLLNGLEPISRLDFEPMFLVASTKSNFKNLKELIDFGKKNPKKIRVGAQRGSAMFLYTHAFMKAAGIDVIYVQFPGGGEAKVALAGGHIDLYFDAGYIYKPLVDGQKAIFLGISSERRHGSYQDIPAFKEQGIDVSWGAWQGLFAPKGTHSDIIQILEKAVEKSLSDSKLLETAEKNQISINYQNRKDFVNFLKNEDNNYRELAIELGIYKPKK